MSAHVVIFGSSTAGKTSLMLGLSHAESDHNFTIDRIWTTRPRRPNENDEENVFVSPAEFEEKRQDFLLPFQTFPTYEYAVDRQAPLADREIRMRILMPVFALKFRSLVSDRTILCAISPYDNNPEAIMSARDPTADPADLTARLRRFHEDDIDAAAVADVRFQNSPGLPAAVARLGVMLVEQADIFNSQAQPCRQY